MSYLHHANPMGIWGRVSNPNGQRFLADKRLRFSLIQVLREFSSLLKPPVGG
jgi:hypothetical protein